MLSADEVGMPIRRFLATLLALWGFWLPDGALCGEKPLWELGVGVAALRMPDYRGSDEYRYYLLPYPYFIYRGDILRVDRERISGRIFETDRFLLDVSLNGSVPVKSSDNPDRQEMPDLVRSVITLGTPFTGHPKATNAWRFYNLVSGQQSHDEDLLAEVRKPPPVPTTSIYSKTDGIVAWQCSINPTRHAHTENIEVHASHIGMGMNPLAMYAIADRLRQGPAHWKRFDVQGARRWFFKVAHQPEMVTQWY